MSNMVPYIEVMEAARETVTKMLVQRTAQRRYSVYVSTKGGKTASVRRNLGTVHLNMPSFPPDTRLTRSEADRMIAYLAHEVCHCLHTDWTAWDKACSEGPHVRHWTNALEDIRIEKLEIETGPYRALRDLLSTLVSHLYAESHEALGKRKQTLGDDIVNAPYIVTVLGRLANGYNVPTAIPLLGQLSPRVRQLVDSALGGLPSCQSTEDCLALARNIVALEQAWKDQDQDQGRADTEPGDQGKDDQGDQGEAEAEGDQGNAKGEEGGQEAEGNQEAEGEGEGEAEGEGKEGTSSGQSDEEAETEGTKGTSSGQGKESDEEEQDESKTAKPDTGRSKGAGGKSQKPQKQIEPDLNLGDTAKEIAARTGKLDTGDQSHCLNSMEVRRTRIPPRADNVQSACDLNARAPLSGVLSGQISRLLVSEARTKTTHHETSGRLDRRALVRMRTGAKDVFSRRDYAPGNDTAVMLLIDGSESMRDPMPLVRVAAWAIGRAAEASGGKLAIAVFYGEKVRTSLMVVKDWTQSMDAIAGTLAHLPVGDTTPLSASIIAASRDLAKVPATRHILMVLTDGQCDLDQDDTECKGLAVKSACRMANTLNVEAVAIGIQCPTVVKAFPERYSVNVADLKELASAGLGTLARMLEQGSNR